MPEVQKTNHSTATTLFEDARFPNLAITWRHFSNRLDLCSKGDGSGGASVLRTVRIKGGIADHEIAQQEADKWFDSLDVFEDESTIESEDEWVED